MVRLYTFIVIMLMSAVTAAAVAQNPGAAAGSASNPSTLTQNHGAKGTGALAQSNLLRVLSPAIGENIKSSMVLVRWEITNPGMAAASSPTYRLQLDDLDPIETMSSSYTFTGIASGRHVLRIDVVDGNHTPIAGSHVEVPFTNAVPGEHSLNPANQGTELAGAQQASLEVPAGDNALPDAGGEMPLLSVIGFGVLLGGLASALKTRR